MPLLTCPNCAVGMTEITRSGVQLDICPTCRGVWLDRGELEKLLTPLREIRDEEQRYSENRPQKKYRDDDDDDDHRRFSDHAYVDPRASGYKPKKKKSVMSMLDILDF